MWHTQQNCKLQTSCAEILCYDDSKPIPCINELIYLTYPACMTNFTPISVCFVTRTHKGCVCHCWPFGQTWHTQQIVDYRVLMWYFSMMYVQNSKMSPKKFENSYNCDPRWVCCLWQPNLVRLWSNVTYTTRNVWPWVQFS